jgi:hypothetical protein
VPHSHSLVLDDVARPGAAPRSPKTAARQRPAVRTLARRLGLTRPTLLLCVAGLLLPNLFSIAAFLLGIGIPPRTSQIVAYAIVALLARGMRPRITVLLFLVVVACDAIYTLAMLFNLTPTEFGLTLQLATELRLDESPFYIAMSVVTVAFLCANLLFLVRKRHVFRFGSAAVLSLAIVPVGAVDFLTNTSPHYKFGTWYAAGQPMTSAAEASGFREAALSGSAPRVLLVLVEALGQFADPEHRALLVQALRRPDVLARYEVTSGSTVYYGSTTNAEMREHCFSRESYKVFLADTDMSCLPRQMKERGYRTTAIHAFTGAFFEREEWYPKIGFDTQVFGEALAERGIRVCRGPFQGPCDGDVLPLVEQELREAREPTFVYWLTLTTHVPVGPREGVGRFGCERGGGPLGHREVCTMTEMWMDVFEGLAAMAASLPATEILIAGDHAPPLWSKAGRALFTPGEVPWFRLKPRGLAAADLRPTIH